MSRHNQLIRKYLLKPVGFFEKQATMREFVILLILLLGGYVVLHWLIPSNSSRSFFKAESDKIRTPILQKISLIKDELKNKEISLLSQLNQAKKNKDAKMNTQSGAATSQIVKTSGDNSLLKVETFEKWKSDLRNVNLSNKEERYLSDLSLLLGQFNELESKDIKDISEDDLIILSLAFNKNLTNLEASLENSLEQNLFWTGNGKWLEVVLWSLFGTLLYIIQQTAEYNLSSTENKDTDQGEDKKKIKALVRRKPQYYYFLFQSPFTALVILWILSMANFNIAGIALALSNAPSEVLISLAFILGLFNRVANTQLSMIVKAIFGEAWTKTVRKIEINKSENDGDQNGTDKNIAYVIFGKCTDFDVLPDVKVKWSIISKPSVGIIDTSTGMYIAPPKGYYYEDAGLKKLGTITPDDCNYTQDIIRAEREDEPNVSALVLVLLVDQPPDKRLEGFDLN